MRKKARCWARGQVSLSGSGCRTGTEPMGRNKASEHKAATKMQLCPVPVPGEGTAPSLACFSSPQTSSS